MAARALAVSGIGEVVIGRRLLHARIKFWPEASKGSLAVVALQAKRERHRTAQQPRIHRAVRRMARLASFDAHRAVLINKRTAFIDVALETRLFVSFHLIDHAWAIGHAPGWIECAVRVMAVSALNGPFVYTMFERHGKLGAHGAVAAITKLGLRFGEKKFRRRRFVDGMARRANDILFGVRAAANIRPGHRLAVAAETRVEDFVRSEL